MRFAAASSVARRTICVRSGWASTLGSGRFDEVLDHAFLARFFEIDRELVAVDFRNPAITEFLMEDALAQLEAQTRRAGLVDRLAVDRDRPALAAARRFRET